MVGLDFVSPNGPCDGLDDGDVGMRVRLGHVGAVVAGHAPDGRNIFCDWHMSLSSSLLAEVVSYEGAESQGQGCVQAPSREYRR